MREQRIVLRDVSDGPLARRYVNSRGGIIEDAARKNDPSRLRTSQPRDGFEKRRLAGARRPEDGRDMGAQRGVELEGEGRERQAEAFERKRHAFVRRFNQTSERKMAPNASAAETARRPYARPSRPVCTSL